MFARGGPVISARAIGLYGAGVAGALYCADATSLPNSHTPSSIALAQVRNSMSTPCCGFLLFASPSLARSFQLSDLLLRRVASSKSQERMLLCTFGKAAKMLAIS